MDYITYIRNIVGNNYVILVAAGALVLDQNNRLLLHKRSDNGFWGIPGGFMELGESAEETARRELYEETGIILGEMELFNVYSGDSRKQILENGHKFYDVIILFICKNFKGDLTLNNESLDVKFFHWIHYLIVYSLLKEIYLKI